MPYVNYVNIRFVSTLTPEDENTVAPAVLKALGSILDLLPIAYMIRIDTSDGQVFQESKPEGRELLAKEDVLLTNPLIPETAQFDS